MSGYKHVCGDGQTREHPRVTTVLGAMMAKPALMNWAANLVAEAAAKGEDKPERAHDRASRASAGRGTMVHGYAASVMHGRPATKLEGLEGYCEQVDTAWRRLEGNGWEVVAVEQPLVDCVTGWAGTADAILRKGSETVVVDWKTTTDPLYGRPFPEHLVQAAAYAAMRHTLDLQSGKDGDVPWNGVDHLCIIRLTPTAHEMFGVHGRRVHALGRAGKSLASAYHIIHEEDE